MNTYSVRVSFEDRKLGPGQGRMLMIDASSIVGAVGKAGREFWKSLNRKERFDAAKSLKIEAKRYATKSLQTESES